MHKKQEEALCFFLFLYRLAVFFAMQTKIYIKKTKFQTKMAGIFL